MRSDHISIEQLTRLAANPESIKGKDVIQSHLAACSSCSAELARIETTAAVSPSDDEIDIGQDVANDKKSRQENEPRPLAHVIAVLNFDSRQLSPAFGVRSGRPVARQLLFSIGENDLDLRVAPDDGAWVVSGQLLGDCEKGEVELRGSSVTEHASMNELCEFFLPPVPPGNYSLLVHTSDMEIEVPEFELRA